MGTDESITVEALAEKVIETSGSKSPKHHLSYEQAYGRPFDDMLIRVPDLTKSKALIGYEPKHSLDQTLRQIVEFERQRM